jgi:hypothetical protein
VLETNPEPLTVRVSAFVPAATLVGLIDVMDSVDGGGVVVPPPDAEPLDPEPPPPQPLIRIEIPSPKAKLQKRNKRNEDLRDELTFTIKPAPLRATL